jgi:hypothetical protein
MTAITEDIEKVIDTGESLPSDKIVDGLKSVTVLEGKENEFESLFTEYYFSKIRELIENIDVNYFECTTRMKSI